MKKKEDGGEVRRVIDYEIVEGHIPRTLTLAETKDGRFVVGWGLYTDDNVDQHIFKVYCFSSLEEAIEKFSEEKKK